MRPDESIQNLVAIPMMSYESIVIFQTAGLQVSAALSNLVYHEYQHSIFDKNVQYITGNMRCEKGYFQLWDELKLGVTTKEKIFQYAK